MGALTGAIQAERLTKSWRAESRAICRFVALQRMPTTSPFREALEKYGKSNCTRTRQLGRTRAFRAASPQAESGVSALGSV